MIKLQCFSLHECNFEDERDQEASNKNKEGATDNGEYKEHFYSGLALILDRVHELTVYLDDLVLNFTSTVEHNEDMGFHILLILVG